MSTYSYKLLKDNKNGEITRRTYKERDLRVMTTFQLREICNREKIVKSIINPLDKEELIRLIMRYRGEEESLFIREYAEGGIDRVESFLKKVDRIEVFGEPLQYPTKITAYEDVNMEIFDNYLLSSNKELKEGNLLLVDSNFHLCGIFNVIKDNLEGKEKFYITRSSSIPLKETKNKHYNLLYLEEKDSENIYHIYYNEEDLIPSNIKFHSLPLLQFEVRKIEDTTLPLAIDFGTSNTTAGIYSSSEAAYGLMGSINEASKEIQFVKVVDSTQKQLEVTPLIPSVVGVKAVENEKVKYYFGYEAIKISQKSYIDDGLTVFYDIKRWINDFERMEIITDSTGKRAFIQRKEVIKAYLEYVINLAKQRFKYNFKYIHISAPAKQKYKFNMLFKEILKDYEIESENTLEEGAAVLFNTISELIENNKYSEGERYKALIIDCGGGTTDLSSCEFSIYNNRVSYEINIETAYENGDTDFGGNNLTYKILQFIKVLIAEKLTKGTLEARASILEGFDIDIFRAVDENGVLPLYHRLNEEYLKAETVIPTRFKEYENRSTEDYYKVKSNYYLLFDIAERVKKEFFDNPSLLRVVLTSEDRKLSEETTTITYDKWKLYSLKNSILEVPKEGPEINLSVFEINTLFKADIYSIIKRFLEKLDRERRLFDFSIIKLTGQSCKVEIFKEALKEFIPGRFIQAKRNKKNTKGDYDLKLACLKGSLKYLQGKKFGYTKVTLNTKKPTLPYVITAFTHRGEEKVLIHGTERGRNKGTISRFMERIVLKLYLKDNNGLIRHEYDYNVNIEDFKPVTAEEILRKYGHAISQQETDTIVNDEVKFFLWSVQEEWGFSLVPVLRQEEGLFIGKEGFFSFENDQWEKNFFDGLK